ncbi:MAG: type II toxin-antitoxin system Phd/YefM family antitoxin [Arenimonas sp.]|nr:type II toxin-antitoxin system Phd/YefM family antitoxin [Arenimonas sp.]
MTTLTASDARANLYRLIDEAAASHEPIVIAGKRNSAYLVNVDDYELQQQRMLILEGIARGEMAVAEGRTLTHAQVEQRFAQWLK